MTPYGPPPTTFLSFSLSVCLSPSFLFSHSFLLSSIHGVCVCVYRYACLCMHREAGEGDQVSCPVVLHLISGRQSLSLILLFPCCNTGLLGKHLAIPRFFPVGPKFHPHACKSSAPTHESSLSLVWFLVLCGFFLCLFFFFDIHKRKTRETWNLFSLRLYCVGAYPS